MDVGKHVPAAPRFKITLSRMIKYETTPGCKACDEVSQTFPHSAACRARFRALLERDGLIDKAELSPKNPPSDVGAGGAEGEEGAEGSLKDLRQEA